jgi:hypothetical protein
METIKPYPIPPWWQPPFATRIEIDKKSAKSKHDATFHNENADGSGIDGHVGATADGPQIAQALRQYLGSDREHNIYATEVTTFELAPEIAHHSPPSYTKCIIYVDSQQQSKASTNLASNQVRRISSLQPPRSKHSSTKARWLTTGQSRMMQIH